MSMRRLWVMVALIGATTACGTLQDVPVPSLVHGQTRPVTAVFQTALGLPVQAPVKFDGAVVGEVMSVDTKDYRAIVHMDVLTSVHLTAASRAEYRLTSPMGEAFVELSSPESASAAPLGDDGVIGEKQTSSAPSVTDMLASVSTLATGGNFADLKIIIDQLSVALDGNGPVVKDLIARANTNVSSLLAHTRQFDVALDSLKRLSAEVSADHDTFASSLHALAPAVRALNGQSKQFFDLLAQVKELSLTAQSVMAQGRTPTLSTLRNLSSILNTLTANQNRFKPIFDGIAAFGAQSESAGWGLFANFDLHSVFGATR